MNNDRKITILALVGMVLSIISVSILTIILFTHSPTVGELETRNSSTRTDANYTPLPKNCLTNIRVDCFLDPIGLLNPINPICPIR